MVKGKIKVIKREERLDTPPALPEKRSGSVGNPPDDGKRDAVTVVAGWVRELRQKKIAETALGFEGLFRKAA